MRAHSSTIFLLVVVIVSTAIISGCKSSQPGYFKNVVDDPYLSIENYEQSDLFKRAESGGESPIYAFASDERSFRFIRLSNQLPVFLISDPHTKEAAAAINISAGGRHDPKSFQGLAHFLEHMLFLGSEKYPEAGDFSAFIAKNGGYDNAYTSFESTHYFFQVNPEAFDEALLRFADMFHAPLLDEAFAEKEVNAVDAEYQSKLRSDSRRIDDASKVLFAGRHPKNKLTVGNRKTLRSDTREEKRRLVTALRDFYDKYYSSSRMQLAITGPQSLDVLEGYVRAFSAIKNNKQLHRPLNLPAISKEVKLRTNGLPLLVVEKLKPGRQLSLRFEIDDIRNYFEDRSAGYVANILGDEGENSLLSELKERGLVNNLSTSFYPVYEGLAEFRIDFFMTEKGVQNAVQVINQFYFAVENILNELNDPARIENARARYAEYRLITETSSRFVDRPQAVSSVSGAVTTARYVDPSKVFIVGALYKDFDPNRIRALLGRLNAENSVAVLAGDQLPNKFELAEESEWFFAKYGLFSQKALCNKEGRNCCIKRAGGCEAGNSSGVHVSKYLPSLNPYLPNVFSLHCDQDIDRPCENLEKQPLETVSVVKPRSYSTPWGNVYWHSDRRFLKPRTHISLMLYQQNGKSDLARQDVLKALYVRMIREALKEKTYAAKTVQLNFSARAHERGLIVNFRGYSQTLPLLWDDVLSAFSPEFIGSRLDQKAFSLIYLALEEAYQRQLLADPLRRINSLLTETILPSRTSTQEKLTALEKISYHDVLVYAREFRNSVRVELLLSGNIAQDDVIAYENKLCVYFPCDSTRPAPPRVKPIELSVQGQFKTLETLHSDNASVWYFQAPSRSISDTSKTWLLAAMLRTAFFKDLRTQQQLGYLVSLGYQPFDRWSGITMSVQSANFTSNEIDAAIAKWLQRFDRAEPSELLSELNFERYKKTLLEELDKPDDSMSEQAARWWQSLLAGDREFERREQIEDQLARMDYDDFIAYAKTMLSVESKRLLKLRAVPTKN